MENDRIYKRQDRSVSPEVAQKISRGLRNYNAVHPRSDEWRQNQSAGLRAYWKKIPASKEDDGGTEDFVL